MSTKTCEVGSSTPSLHWDPLEDFIAQCCVMDGETPRNVLYNAYRQWQTSAPHYHRSRMGTKLFAQEMRIHHPEVGKRKSMGIRYWTGIRLKEYSS